MDLLQSMRVFQCVVDEGGFAVAARKMELAPAVVTRLIQDLEQSLGVRLLQRTTRRMSLTQAGEGYLSRLRLILSEIDEAADQARAHSSEISGSLRVATTSLVAVNLLAPCVADFQRQHPAVQVEIHTSDRPGQDLHQFDLSIVRQDDHLDADVVVRRCSTWPMSCAARRATFRPMVFRPTRRISRGIAWCAFAPPAHACVRSAS